MAETASHSYFQVKSFYLSFSFLLGTFCSFHIYSLMIGLTDKGPLGHLKLTIVLLFVFHCHQMNRLVFFRSSRGRPRGHASHGWASFWRACNINTVHLPLQHSNDQYLKENWGTVLRHSQNLQHWPQYGGQGAAGDRVLKESWRTWAAWVQLTHMWLKSRFFYINLTCY